ncbi:phospho-N-acetylmuramoyl-pentapeptide-transferase [Fannyhessea vaginae]|uniref:phospho-N-acetylmuramoyl-pentapeptide- transferase n=1 Tax=Fannyhessea vaginae TaxID=82135 RepID=UPI0026F1218F|nr:phospho-N-acetylmuramoyl-pentapeptide-transferase [Fannyhessea vaginae]
MLGNPMYPTYQVFLAVGIAACIAAGLMPLFIRLMRMEGFGQQIRADGPKRHLIKQGTPTMGGVVMLCAILITSVLLSGWSMRASLAMLAMFATGLLGFLDDIESVSHKRSLGLTASQKMLGLVFICMVFCLAAVNLCGVSPTISFPGHFSLDLGVLSTTFTIQGMLVSVPWLYLVFVFLLMAGMSNATNLTDGLDGLAGGCSLVVMLCMAMVAFLYNEIDLAIFSASIAGACIGFLWHNCYPASIFMGDTGSLALGGAFAALAVLTKTEVISLIMGGLFVIEAISVIIQVISFHFFKKRVFLMAPLHHHFEKKGWGETKVVIRFWIVSSAFAALGFALYFQLR